jgi:arginine:ornithine antiporter/lysine permease
LLEKLVGPWGAIFVVISLLISLSSCWLSWTILVAELPYRSAQDGIFPKFLSRENQFRAPASSLWVSSTMMQIAIFSVLFAQDTWRWLLSATGVMILPSYLVSAIYLCRVATTRLQWFTGILGTVYAIWLLAAAGAQFLLVSTILFALGLPVFVWAQREKTGLSRLPFNQCEKAAVAVLILIAGASLLAFMQGTVKIY